MPTHGVSPPPPITGMQSINDIIAWQAKNQWVGICFQYPKTTGERPPQAPKIKWPKSAYLNDLFRTPSSDATPDDSSPNSESD